MQIILASGSSIRADMLRQAGVSFEVDPARIDETALIAALQDEEAKPRDIADTLAEYKARRIAGRHPQALVIGADQVLACNGRLFEKPRDLSEARTHLKTLRGQTHQLLSAVVVYEAAQPVWRAVGRAQLTMRDVSDAFLDTYVNAQGDDLLTSVGCYKLEGAGVSLFSRVEGDYFSVLGLPLLELLDFLRGRGAIPK